VEFVDGVEHQRRPGGELLVQRRRLEALPDVAAASDDGLGVAVGGDGFAVGGEAEPRGFEPVPGQDRVEVVPADQPSDGRGIAACDQVGAAERLGEARRWATEKGSVVIDSAVSRWCR
jgi:hypothetical protein